MRRLPLCLTIGKQYYDCILPATCRKVQPAGRFPYATSTYEKPPRQISRYSHRSKVTVDPLRKIGVVDRRFFGVNSLFWIEDDKALSDPQLAAYLQDLKCGLLRYPGGEVGDNYHWKTNMLDDRKYWPRTDGPGKTDTDEFMAWCKTIGAEPIFVVNLDSAMLHGNPEAGIREAADWVRYCNLEKKYNVRYWEIGNETYLRSTRYPLASREYAAAVKSFSLAMKAVDPSILIGAVGPIGPRDIVPFDQILPKFRDEARKVQVKELRLKAVETAIDKHPGPNPDMWWPTLCKYAGENFDFAVIHQYKSARDYQNFALNDSQLRMGPATLTQALGKYLNGREMPLALTEWNISSDTSANAEQHALMCADHIFQYLQGGVKMANAWPLRLKAPKKDRSEFRPLLTADPLTRRPFYYVFKEISTKIGETLVECRSDNPACSVLASYSKGSDQISVFLINKLEDTPSSVVKLDINDQSYKPVSANALTFGKGLDATVTTSSVQVTPDGEGYQCELPPGSLATLLFHRNSR